MFKICYLRTLQRVEKRKFKSHCHSCRWYYEISRLRGLRFKSSFWCMKLEQEWSRWIDHINVWIFFEKLVTNLPPKLECSEKRCFWHQGVYGTMMATSFSFFCDSQYQGVSCLTCRLISLGTKWDYPLVYHDLKFPFLAYCWPKLKLWKDACLVCYFTLKWNALGTLLNFRNKSDVWLALPS